MSILKTILLCATVALTTLSACNNSESNKNNSTDMKHHGHSDSKGKIEVKVTSEPQVIEADKPTNLTIAITEHGKNVP